jgi:hypothetical protein
MFEITRVRVAPDTSAAVLRMLTVLGETCSLDTVVEHALQEWLRKVACDDPQAAQAAARGYQWKSLFLPEGTCLRFSYKGEYHHAEVRGDELVYKGLSFSPRQWLLHVTGTVRNAWRELWLRCPGDARWHLANTRRCILRRTPQGRHSQGIDVPHPLRAGAPGQAATAPHRSPRFAISDNARAIYLRRILYRDDLVRADQPDLVNRLGGAGQGRAGRSGPRDRRYGNTMWNVREELATAARAAPPGNS